MRRDITPEDEAERLVRLRERHGFDAFKIRIGKECGHDEDEWPGRTEAARRAGARRARRRRSAARRREQLLHACAARSRSAGCSSSTACSHFEEPCPYWELEWTREVAQALELDVTGGEQDWDLGVWRRMVEMRAVDVVQPDVCYVGGLTRALRVAALAEATRASRARRTPRTTRSCSSSRCTCWRRSPNAGPYVEFSIEPDADYPWQAGMYEPRPEVVDGTGAGSRRARAGASRSRPTGSRARSIASPAVEPARIARVIELTPEQREIQALCREFAANEIRPISAAVDEADTEMPWEIWHKAAALGLTSFMLPERFGGGGMEDSFTQALVQEELCFGCAGHRQPDHVERLLRQARARARRRGAGAALGRAAHAASVRRSAPLASTEPGVGSDAAAMTTTAERVDGGYVLRGQKSWISSAGAAEYYVVFATVAPGTRSKGITAFLRREGRRRASRSGRRSRRWASARS